MLGCYEDSHDDDVTQVSSAFSLVSSFSFTFLCMPFVAMLTLNLFGFVMKPDINLFFSSSLASLCYPVVWATFGGVHNEEDRVTFYCLSEIIILAAVFALV